MNKAQRDIRRKKRVLEHAVRIGNMRKTCRYFSVLRSAVYLWKKAYEERGDAGLINQKPCPTNPTLRTPPAVSCRGARGKTPWSAARPARPRVGWYP